MIVQPTFSNQTITTFSSRINSFINLETNNSSGGLTDYIVLKSFKEGALVIPYTKIVRVEAAKSYSMFYFADGTRFFSSHNLSYHARQLDPRFFQRIHKSHIVNLNMIKEVINDKVKKVVLTDGTLIEISRRKASRFVRIFKLMMAASF